MVVLISIITLISGFLLGYNTHKNKLFLEERKRRLEYKLKVERKFEEFNSALLTGNSKFVNRINNNVHISFLAVNAYLDAVYFIDRGVIVIVDQTNKIEYTSSELGDGVYENHLINNIVKIYNKDISDTVTLNGVVYSRKVLERSIKEMSVNIDEDFIRKVIPVVDSEEDVIELNIEVILDKINEHGIESLTPEEKDFLDNYSKNI